jgi:hypothetical protein
MGKSSSKTHKSSSKKIINNNIAPIEDKSKNIEKENKIIEKGSYLDYLDPNNPSDKRNQYISPAARQDLNSIFFD